MRIRTEVTSTCTPTPQDLPCSPRVFIAPFITSPRLSRQHHGRLRSPAKPHAVIPADWPLDQPRHVGDSRLHDNSIVASDLVDRELAQIADVSHLPSHAVLPISLLRLVGEAHFLGP